MSNSFLKNKFSFDFFLFVQIDFGRLTKRDSPIDWSLRQAVYWFICWFNITKFVPVRGALYRFAAALAIDPWFRFLLPALACWYLISIFTILFIGLVADLICAHYAPYSIPRASWSSIRSLVMGRKGEVNNAPANNPDFPVSARELSDLMRQRGEEALQTINDKYGGVAELCKKLKTSPTEG